MSTDQVTELLRQWSEGDQNALDQPGHILQTSALINEAYLRLVEQPKIRWENRSHFFGIAARLMRQILVDEGTQEEIRQLWWKRNQSPAR